MPSLGDAAGGLSKVGRELTSSLRDLGWDARIVGCGSARAPHERGLEVLSSFHGTPIPRSFGALKRAVTSSDVVHVLGLRDPVGTYAALLASKRGLPLCLEPSGMFERKSRSLRLKRLWDGMVGDRVVQAADRIIVTSQEELREFQVLQNGNGLLVRPNGVDLSDLQPLPSRGLLRERLGVPASAKVVLALGRISRIKRLDVLIQAVARLPEAWGVIAGPVDDERTLGQLRQLRADLRCSRVVLEPQGYWGDDRRAAFSDADVVYQVSDSENFGLAAAEAVCLGIPVVISNTTGVRSWLRAPHIAVPAGDIEATTRAIAELLADSRSKLRAEELAPILRRQLEWSRVARQQAEIYESLL